MLLLLAAVALQGPVADTITTPVITTERRTAPIHVDGRLDEPDWRRAPAATELIQSNPYEGEPATERSEFWITFDDEAVYVAARFHDAAPDSVISWLTRRDGFNQSDVFSVFLDPYHDGQTGYQFLVNAAGVQRDAALYNDNASDDTWDGVWESAVGRFEGGWIAEVRIPLSQLRLRDTPDQVWGINFARGIGRRNEFSYTVPRLRQGSGFVSRFARLEGLQGIKPRRRLEALPYIVGRSRHAEASAGDPFFDGSHQSASAGIDLRVGLGNLQLDATVNPDFGQVEVDPAVVNLTDFETRFQERRPFFVEGTNLFLFGGLGLASDPEYGWPVVQPFYSRRIGRPPVRRLGGPGFVDAPGGVSILGAAKLTGKVGDWNVAALGALTDREMARTSGTGGIAGQEIERVEVEPLAGYAVGRLQRDFAGGRHGIGFLATRAQRSFEDPELRTITPGNSTFLGIDGWLTLDRDREWVLGGWGGTTRVSGDEALVAAVQRAPGHYFQRPDADHLTFDPGATSLSGRFGRLQLNRQRGAVIFNTAVGAVSPGFDGNDLGFTSNADVINAHVRSGYRWTRPTSWYQSAQFLATAFANWDFGGTRTLTGLNTNLSLTFLDISNAYIGTWSQFEAMDTRATRGGPAIIDPASHDFFGGWSSDVRDAVSYGMDLSLGLAAADPGPSWAISPSIAWRPSSSVNLSFSPSLRRDRSTAWYVGRAPDPLATATGGVRYLFGELDQYTLSGTLRADWILSPKASLQLFVQPLVSSVRYTDIKELQRPGSYDFRTFGTAGSTIDREAGIADPDGDGPAPEIALGQPDFTFASLRGNAVLRWEYATGSTLYLVWTQQRQFQERFGDFRPRDTLGDLFDASGQNVLLLKVSYWLSR